MAKNEGGLDRIEIISRDFSRLLQGSCCINKIYLRVCQTYFKEYIKEFPFLIFQKNILLFIAQIIGKKHLIYFKIMVNLRFFI